MPCSHHLVGDCCHICRNFSKYWDFSKVQQVWLARSVIDQGLAVLLTVPKFAKGACGQSVACGGEREQRRDLS